MDENPAPQAENTVVAEVSNEPALPASEPTTSAPAEPVAQEPSSDVTAEAAPAAEEPAAEPERQPSRAERTIRQKDGIIKNLSEELRQYRDQASVPPPEVPQPRLSELVQGKESLDPQELDQMGQQVAQAAKVNTDLKYQQLANRMVINEAITEAEKDAAVAMNTYDELNDSKDSYVPDLEKKIEARYRREAFVPNPLNPTQKLLNPNVKLADIAKEEVEAFRQAAEYGKAQTNATLATQADNSAVTPTATAPVEKSFEEMSLPEQEAYLRAKGHDV